MTVQPDFLAQDPGAFLESSPSAFLQQGPEDFLTTGVVPAPDRVADDKQLGKVAVAIAAAVVVLRMMMKTQMQQEQPRSPEEIAAAAQRIYDRVFPAWVRIAAPAFAQAYRLGATDTIKYSELEKMAEAYVSEIGDYIHQSSIRAVSEGFNAQINAGWSERLAWTRAAEGYGLDSGQMRSYIKGLMSRDTDYGVGDVIPDAARASIDRAFLIRADRLGQQEAFTATQVGRNVVWLTLQASGQLPDGAMKRWITAEDERVCPVCAPLDQVTIPLQQRFESGGRFFYAPSVHPNCRCEIELVYPDQGINVVKAMPGDPFDRDRNGRFAVNEQRAMRVKEAVRTERKEAEFVEEADLRQEAALGQEAAFAERKKSEATFGADATQTSFSIAAQEAEFEDKQEASAFSVALKPYEIPKAKPRPNEGPPFQKHFGIVSADAIGGALTFPRGVSGNKWQVGHTFIIGRDDPGGMKTIPVHSSRSRLTDQWTPVRENGSVSLALKAAFDLWFTRESDDLNKYHDVVAGEVDLSDFTKFGADFTAESDPEVYRQRMILANVSSRDLKDIWRRIHARGTMAAQAYGMTAEVPGDDDPNKIAAAIIEASANERYDADSFYRDHGYPLSEENQPIKSVLDDVAGSDPLYEVDADGLTDDEIEFIEERLESARDDMMRSDLLRDGAIVTPVIVVMQGWYGSRGSDKATVPGGAAMGEYTILDVKEYPELPAELANDLTDKLINGIKVVTVVPAKPW